MRAVIKNDISMDQLPKVLQKRCQLGMCVLEGKAPENIDEEGKEAFKQIKELSLGMGRIKEEQERQYGVWPRQ